jgi:hypothetical protein
MSKDPGWTITPQLRPSPQFIPWATGRFYGYPYARGLTTASTNLISIGAISFYVPNIVGVTVTTLNIEVTVGGGAGSICRLGLYNTLSNGVPGRLIIDAGTTATTGTGAIAISISQFLRQGWYFAAATFGVSAPTTRQYALASESWALGDESPSNVGNTPIGYTYTGASGVYAANGLPKDLPIGSGFGTTTFTRILVGI